MGQSDGQMKSDDGDITEPEKRTAVGVGRQSRCVSRLPACIFAVVKVTRWGGQGGLSEADEGVEPRCVSETNSLEGRERLFTSRQLAVCKHTCKWSFESNPVPTRTQLKP